MEIQMELELNNNWCLSDEQIKIKYHDFIFIDPSNYFVLFNDINGECKCLTCNEELDANNNCNKCNKTYDKYKLIDLEKDKLSRNVIIYDIHGLNFFIYDVKVIYDYNQLLNNSSDILDISIKKYYLSQEGIIDIDNNTLYSFKTYIEGMRWYINYDEKYFDSFNEIIEGYDLLHEIDELYLDNIDEVCNHPYFKHTCLKDIINYMIEKGETLNLENTIMYSMCFKEREYLFKLGLKRLATCYCYYFVYKGSFINTFGIDKNYLSFMVENDLSYNDFLGLKKYKIKDIAVCNFVGFLILFDSRLDIYEKIGIKKAAYYYQNDKDGLYIDYINMVDYLGMNLKDKDVVFPKNLKEAHDKAMEMCDDVKYKQYNESIVKYYNKASINRYEDDNYVILPAPSFDSLKDESRQMNNCVRTYANKIAKGECQIYFMRKKANINTSLATIEVRGVNVVQAKIKNNMDIPYELKQIVNKFENNLKPII